MALYRKAIALFLFLPFAGLLLGAAPVQQSEEPPFVGLVTGNGVNLRSGPGRSYEVLLSLARGTRLHVLERQGSWYAVSLPEGIPAYLNCAYAEQSGDGWGKVKGSRVQVRVHPSEESTAWGELSAPARVRVLGSYGEWIKIEPPPFCRGWVHQEFVTFVQKEEVSAQGAAS